HISQLVIRMAGAVPTSMRRPERALCRTSRSSKNGEELVTVTEPVVVLPAPAYSTITCCRVEPDWYTARLNWASPARSWKKVWFQSPGASVPGLALLVKRMG